MARSRLSLRVTILAVSLSSARYTMQTKMMLCKDPSIYRDPSIGNSSSLELMSLSLELMSLTKIRAVL